jgi:hypothetical protein
MLDGLRDSNTAEMLFGLLLVVKNPHKICLELLCVKLSGQVFQFGLNNGGLNSDSLPTE